MLSRVIAKNIGDVLLRHSVDSKYHVFLLLSIQSTQKRHAIVSLVTHHAEIMKYKTGEVKKNFVTDKLQSSPKIKKLNQQTKCGKGAKTIKISQ